jgi:hypothetical protein
MQSMNKHIKSQNCKQNYIAKRIQTLDRRSVNNKLSILSITKQVDKGNKVCPQEN